MQSTLLSLAAALLLTCVSAAPTMAQRDFFREVGNGDIAFRDQIVGYYFLFTAGKQGGKESGFRLRLTDADLEPIQDFDIELRTGSRVVDAKYNGEAICVVFADVESSRLHVETFSLAGESLGERDFKLRPKEVYLIATRSAAATDGASNLLGAVPGAGFTMVVPTPHKSYTVYDMHFFPNDLSEEPDAGAWTVEPRPRKGEPVEALNLYATDEYIVTRVARGVRRLRRNEVEVRRVRDGELVFAYDPDGHGVGTEIVSGIYDHASETFVLAGAYFPADDTYAAGEATGIALRRVGLDGEEVARVDVPWEEALAPLGASAVAHAADEEGKLYLHRVFPRPGGGLAAVADARMTTKALKKWRRVTGHEAFQDFVVVEVDGDFAVADVHGFDSETRRKSLYGTPGYYGGIPLAPNKIELGHSRYEFAQLLPEGYVVAFRRDVDPEDASSRTSLVVVSDTGDGPYEKVLHHNPKAEYTKWLPGKPGYLIVNDVYEDESKSTVRFEPVD